MDKFTTFFAPIFSLPIILFAAVTLAFILAFPYSPVVDTGLGSLSVVVGVAGLLVIFRTYARQRDGLATILAAIIAGLSAYYLLHADPFVMVATLALLAIFEGTDALTRRFTRMKFFYRVLWTTVMAVPIGAAAFLYIVNELTPANYLALGVSQYLGALVILAYHACREAAECDRYEIEEYTYMSRL